MKKRLNNKVLAIFLIVLIDVLGLTIMLPLLPFYSEKYGATPFVVGLLVSVYALAQFISGPILGDLSDKYGRKPVLIISQIGTCIGFLMLAFANNLFWIFFARIIDGLTAGNITTAQAYIADHTSHEDRAKAMGKISIAFSIGFFIGPALTAFLYHYGVKVPILMAAMLSLCSILASIFLLEEDSSVFRNQTRVKHKNYFSIYTNSLKYFKEVELRNALIQIFLFYFSFSAYMSGFALFCERQMHLNGILLNPRMIGYAFTYSGFIGIFVQTFLIGFSVNKFKENKVIIASFMSCCLGYLILSQVDNAWFLILTGLFISVGSGLLRPVLISEISKLAHPSEKGKVIGVNQSLQSIAQIIAPMVSTFIIGNAHLSIWPLFPALLTVIGIMFAITVKNKQLTKVGV